MKDAKLMILGALPIFLIPAAFLASVRIDPAWTALSPQERTLFDYTPEEALLLTPRTDERPKEASVMDAGFFKVKKKGGTNAKERREGGGTGVKIGGSGKKKGAGELTLLVFNGERSMAVISGAVVRRGDTVEGMTVKRIEKDRVLVLDENLRWIYMEGER